MPDMSAIENTPEISFIDNKTVEDVRSEMVADYEEHMTQAQGVTVSLDRASVHRMILYAAAAQIYQAMQYIDRQGKQSILKYSYSDYLDNLALFKGVTRSPATAATCTLRFTLAAERETATAIPQGTRVASSGSVYFATDEYAEIPPGSTEVEVAATCTETGSAGNGLTAGELSTMVDPVPYVASVTNTATTEGGAEIESDADLAERVFWPQVPIPRRGRRTATYTTPRRTARPLGMWWQPATRRPARWILFSLWPTEQSLGRK